MPVSVPTTDEAAAVITDLQAQVDDLIARVTALEQGTPVDPGDIDPPPGNGNDVAPFFTSGPVILGNPVLGQTLRVSYEASGNPAPVAHFSWWNDLPTGRGSDQPTLGCDTIDVGHMVGCEVRLTNGCAPDASVQAPAVGPVTSEQGTVDPPPDIEEPPDPVDPLPPGSNPTVAVVTLTDNTTEMTQTAYTFDAADGEDLGDYVDPRGRFTMGCRRIKVEGCPIWVDYRTIPEHDWACFVFWYSDAFSGYRQNLRGYTVDIGGTVVTVPSHSAASRWRQCFRDGVADTAEHCWPFALIEPATLFSEGWTPCMDAAVTSGNAEGNPAYGTLWPSTYTPQSMAGLNPSMGDTGAHYDIGLVTGWQGYVLSGGTPVAGSPHTSAQQLSTVFAHGEAVSSFPIWFTDHATGAQIDPIVAYPNARVTGGASPQLAWVDNRARFKMLVTGPKGTVVAGNMSGGPSYSITTTPNHVRFYNTVTIPDGGRITVDVELDESIVNCDFGSNALAITPSPPYIDTTFQTVPNSYIPCGNCNLDTAHIPSPAYVPWLLSGDPYYLEATQALTTYCYTYEGMWNYDIPGQKPFLCASQMRAMGWALRALVQSAAATPEEVPCWLLPKHVFTTGLENQRLAYQQFADTSTAVQQTVFRNFMRPWEMGISSFQTDYMALSVIFASRLFPEWEPLRDFVLGSVRATAGGTDGVSGWCKSYPSWYYAEFRALTQGADPSWATLWQDNVGAWSEASWGPPTCLPTLTDALNGGSSDCHYQSDFLATKVASMRVARWAGDTSLTAILADVEPQIQAAIFPGSNMAIAWHQCFS